MPICAHRAPRTTRSEALIAAPRPARRSAVPGTEAQALIKVNDNVNFKLGVLIQPQADFQEVANATNNGSAATSRTCSSAGSASSSAGRSRRTSSSSSRRRTRTSASPRRPSARRPAARPSGTGFNLLDAVGEWRIAKEFNIQFGEIRVADQPRGPQEQPDRRSCSTCRPTPFSRAPRSRTTRAATRASCSAATSSATASSTARRSSRRLPRSPASRTRRASRTASSTTSSTPRSTTSPSYAGANFGNKKILALGGAYDTQGDYRYASADMYLDFPIPSARSSPRSSTSTSTAARS